MKVSTVEQMRTLDRIAVERYGIPDMLLMENAGLAVFEAIKAFGEVQGRRFTIISGSGNNGGDGFVVARKIHSEGGRVRVILFGREESLQGSARKNYDICTSLGISIHSSRVLKECNEIIRNSDVLVDGLFGTGLTRAIEGEYADLVSFINGSGKPVMSIDVPSGIHGDTGKVMGLAVKAAATVTFGLPKFGNILYPGYTYCGKLSVSHISFPPEHYSGEQLTTALNTPLAMPERNPEGHKGSFGKALFIAGAASYYGAPLFSSRAFLKAGGGYSRLAAPRSIIPTLATRTPEVVYHPLEETADGSIAAENFSRLTEIIGGGKQKKVDLVIAGPGLSEDKETAALVCRISETVDLPLIIDGDGLSAVAGKQELLAGRSAPTVLTPHPGEMSRLLDTTVEKIIEDPLESARDAAKRYQAVVVGKGARSCIALPDGRVWINYTGNAGMGTAGSGDVLAGAIPAMVGLGLAVEDAVRAGVHIHGLAGDLAAEEKGEDGITAEDLCEFLPRAVQRYRNAKPFFL